LLQIRRNALEVHNEIATVLTLDHDPLQLQMLSWLLGQDRHTVLATAEPELAFLHLENERVDLAIVDTSGPGHDGYRICQQIRQLQPRLPILVLSTRADEDHIVRILLAAADDFLAKPFSPRIFLARVHSLLRRVQVLSLSVQAIGTLTLGEVSLNWRQMQALVNGRPLHLTPRELSLLDALMTHASSVLSRDQLMRLAWGDDFLGCTKAVDVCIQRIRMKMRPHLGVQHIHSVRGFGYKFEQPPPSRAGIRAVPSQGVLQRVAVG
jgi:DNA-binding response OmpR family regulator